MRCLVIIAAAIALAGCQTTSVAVYCDLAKPIYWSRGDTIPTKKQIAAHNAVWKSQNCRAVVKYENGKVVRISNRNRAK